MAPLRKSDLRRLFELATDELRQADALGDVILVGAGTCLAYGARASRRHAIAFFRPPEKGTLGRLAMRIGAHFHGAEDVRIAGLSQRRRFGYSAFIRAFAKLKPQVANQ